MINIKNKKCSETYEKIDLGQLYSDQLYNFQAHWIEDMRIGVGAFSALIILISSTSAQDGKISFIATEFEIISVV